MSVQAVLCLGCGQNHGRHLAGPCQRITQFPVARGSPLLSHPRPPNTHLPPHTHIHTHGRTHMHAHTCSGETWQDSRWKFSSLTTALLPSPSWAGTSPSSFVRLKSPRSAVVPPPLCIATVVAWCTQAPYQVRMFGWGVCKGSSQTRSIISNRKSVKLVGGWSPSLLKTFPAVGTWVSTDSS